MRDVEKKIQEQRSIEATKKKLMGFNGKIGCIVRNLGYPIISHSEGGAFHEYGESIDYWNDTDENSLEDIDNANEFTRRLPTMQVLDEMGNPISNVDGKEWGDPNDRINATTSQSGWAFDGLSRGLHLEIKYEDASSLLVVSYQGYEVYKEVGGELLGYAPNDAWESKIEQLYIIASKLNDMRKGESKIEETSNTDKSKKSWLLKFMKKWGL